MRPGALYLLPHGCLILWQVISLGKTWPEAAASRLWTQFQLQPERTQTRTANRESVRPWCGGRLIGKSFFGKGPRGTDKIRWCSPWVSMCHTWDLGNQRGRGSPQWREPQDAPSLSVLAKIVIHGDWKHLSKTLWVFPGWVSPTYPRVLGGRGLSENFDRQLDSWQGVGPIPGHRNLSFVSGNCGKLPLKPPFTTLGLSYTIPDETFIDFPPTTVHLHTLFLLPRILSPIFFSRKFRFFHLFKTSWKVTSSLRPSLRQLLFFFVPLKLNLYILTGHIHLSFYTCACTIRLWVPKGKDHSLITLVFFKFRNLLSTLEIFVER